MKHQTAVLIVFCTLAIVAAILGPRFIPRYVDAPGGAVDRWTGRTCITVLSELIRERGDYTRPLTCSFGGGKMIQQEYNSTRWHKF